VGRRIGQATFSKAGLLVAGETVGAEVADGKTVAAATAVLVAVGSATVGGIGVG